MLTVQQDMELREFYKDNMEGYWAIVLSDFKDPSFAASFINGFARGFSEGFVEGFAKGQAEERKNLLAAGRALLDDGMDRLKVQRLTKLSDEEMASICAAN